MYNNDLWSQLELVKEWKRTRNNFNEFFSILTVVFDQHYSSWTSFEDEIPKISKKKSDYMRYVIKYKTVMPGLRYSTEYKITPFTNDMIQK